MKKHPEKKRLNTDEVFKSSIERAIEALKQFSKTEFLNQNHKHEYLRPPTQKSISR